jgi:glycosyltransferase involved in cell wall biosynthesis
MKRYPRLSETFILNEIAVMERLGVRLTLFSLLQPEPPPHHPMVKDIRAPLYHLPPLVSAKIASLARAHGTCLARAPLRYLRALVRAAGASVRSRRPLGVWKQFVRAGFVADRCRRAGVTLIHAHFANAPGAVASFASTMSGIPFSFTAHAKDLYLTPPPVVARRVREAAFVATCTGYNVAYLKGITPRDTHGKIHLVYHGIDLDRFAPSDKVRIQAEGMPLILSVGRLVPKKGFGDLIAACDLLQKGGIRFRCVIVGEGPLRSTLEADIARRGLADLVMLKGAMTHAGLLTFYREADVFALAPCIVADGDRDGIPNVIVEAMASGVPVVSTMVSGIPELVQDDVTGLLVPPESPRELAEAMRRLLGDPQSGIRLARNARMRLEKDFSARETTKALRDLMLAGGGNGSAPEVPQPVLPGQRAGSLPEPAE